MKLIRIRLWAALTAPLALALGAPTLGLAQESKPAQEKPDEHAGHNHPPGQHGKPQAQKPAPDPRRNPNQKPTPAQGKGGNLNPYERGRYGGQVDPNAKLAIEFGTDKHDFGRCMQGELLEHSFQFAAGGTSDLVIRQAKPTCGCTVGQLETSPDGDVWAPYSLGDPLKPGTMVRLGAKLDTTSKRNKTQVRINVYTNDPVGVTQLSLQAQIDPFLIATPTFLNFGDLRESSIEESTIDIRTAKGEMVKIELDTTRRIPKPDGMEVELKPLQPDDEGKASHWQVHVKVGPDLKEGPLGYAMTLKSDKEIVGGKKLPNGQVSTYQVNVNANARVLGVISCQPQYLSMGLVRPGQVVKRTVQLVSHDENFQLGEAKVTTRGFRGAAFPWSDHFEVSTEPVPGKNAVAITLNLTGLPDGADGSFKGEMVIETGHPDKPEHLVTFSGVCRSGVGSAPRVRSNPGETRPQPGVGPQRPAPAKPTGSQPTGTQPVGAKPVGAKPVGAKPVGAKPVGAKPVGAKPVGAKPVGAKPVGKKPAEPKKPDDEGGNSR